MTNRQHTKHLILGTLLLCLFLLLVSCGGDDEFKMSVSFPGTIDTELSAPVFIDGEETGYVGSISNEDGETIVELIFPRSSDHTPLPRNNHDYYVSNGDIIVSAPEGTTLGEPVEEGSRQQGSTSRPPYQIEKSSLLIIGVGIVLLGLFIWLYRRFFKLAIVILSLIVSLAASIFFKLEIAEFIRTTLVGIQNSIVKYILRSDLDISALVLGIIVGFIVLTPLLGGIFRGRIKDR